jgi:hypothetical protein
MYETATGHAVRESLRQIIASPGAPSAAARQALEVRVSAAVDELKRMNWPVERILIRLKELANEVGFAPPHDAFGRDRDAIMADLLRMCIARYYDGDN